MYDHPAQQTEHRIVGRDVQNGVVDGTHARDSVVANVAALVDRARREVVPVVWVQHSSENLARGSGIGSSFPS